MAESKVQKVARGATTKHISTPCWTTGCKGEPIWAKVCYGTKLRGQMRRVCLTCSTVEP